MEEQLSPVAVTHLLQHTLRSLCTSDASQWVYAVFWRILPRNYPPPKWDLPGVAYDRSRGNRRNWILAWEDGFCNFAATTAACGQEGAGGAAGAYADCEAQELLMKQQSLQPELFFKMSHDIYNYGEGLIGKVAADHSHKWVFKEPQEQQETSSLISSWSNPADSQPRTWEAQFQSGIQTIALIAVREGVVQLGSMKKDLIAGGTESSATTVEWAMSEILKKPEVFAKTTEELDRVVGRGRWVTEQDIPSLPYVEAIVKETMRLHPVAPMLAPRLSREDASVGGYDIPTGTRVLVSVWSIGRDPALWDAPEEFVPDRFLGSRIDVKGQDFELLPFGSGRRMCPGYSLGLKVIQVSLANLLHGFSWRLPDTTTKEELNMEENFGLSTPRKFPLEVVADPKLLAHLYADA